jgi:hypothetical protein
MLPGMFDNFDTNETNQKLVRRIWWILRSKTLSGSSVSDENLPTELSEFAHIKAAKYLWLAIPLGEDIPPQKELTALPALLAGMRLGRLRLDIKKHLAKEMKEIDGLVKRVIS